VAERGGTVSPSKRISPTLFDRMLDMNVSSCVSVGGIHAQPISVMTNFRRGNRSNTPPSVR
jgi:hypothetical protein